MSQLKPSTGLSVSGAPGSASEMQAWNAQLMAQVQSLREDLARKDQIILQLNRITSEFFADCPDYTQRIPFVRPGEDPIIAVVRSVVSSLRKKISALEAANKEVSAALKAKDEFIAIVSHEIRTPLNGIIGMLNVLMDSEMTEEQAGHFQMVQDSASQLLTILNDVLDYSKLKSRKIRLEKRVFDPEQLVVKVLRTFAGAADEKKISLEYTVGENLPSQVEGDEMRIGQVLSNLVGNAIKFTEKGKVHINAMLLESKGDRSMLRFKISDTGMGIPLDRQQRMFEPFTQQDASISRRFGGTGLGLAISKSLVQQMGGEIWAESVVGEGTVFRFTVEIGEVEPPAKTGVVAALPQRGGSPFASLASYRGNGRRILLAEDNPVNQKVARLTLEKLGYHPIIAENGRQAVEIAAAEEFDIILMDLTMPELDGLEATKEIRKLNNGSAHARIIAMTGHVFDDDRERCLQAGMDDYISKPVDLADLQRALADEVALTS
ncbi:MAG: ATP-binding protein [Verrucomicrobiales bacterium]|nr:response regulator [Verrucomicrobiae bacterium]MCP5554349.1 response regulator [Akkermansiaceae bacterium]